jgi:hypothetical protein
MPYKALRFLRGHATVDHAIAHGHRSGDLRQYGRPRWCLCATGCLGMLRMCLIIPQRKENAEGVFAARKQGCHLLPRCQCRAQVWRPAPVWASTLVCTPTGCLTRDSIKNKKDASRISWAQVGRPAPVRSRNSLAQVWSPAPV